MLVGRQAETKEIDQLLAAARDGRSGVLVIRGEAGIGKSALMEHARTAADGMTILRGIGIESESELPFSALHQVLRPAFGRIEHLPAPQAAALRSAFALSDETVAERFHISLAVLGLFAEMAEERPLLCLVDDVQWLDQASAEALLFAARRLVAEPMAMLFAARDDETGTFAAPGLPELRLSGLELGEARELVATRVGARATPQVVDWVIESAHGNPLALVELPTALTPDQLAGRDALIGTVPPPTSVEQTYLERVSRLPEDTRDVLLLAAAEETGDRETITRAAGSLGLQTQAIAAAEQHGLVQVDIDRIAFRHPLLRSAVYRSASFAQRERAHRALADVLTDPSDVDRRAWHRAAGAVGTDEGIARELETTAARATSRGGYMAAATALERAAGLSPEEADRARRLVSAAEAAWLAGRAKRSRQLLSQAEAVAPAELSTRVTQLKGRIGVRRGDFAEAMAMLLSAAQGLSTSDPEAAVRLLVEAEEATLYTGDRGAPAQIAQLAQQLVPRCPPGVVRASATILVGVGRVFAGQYAEAAPMLRDAVASGAESEDLDHVLLLARVASAIGDDAATMQLSLRALQMARERGAVGALPRILERVPFYEIQAGNFESARAHAAEGLSLAREMDQEPGVHLCEIALVAAMWGRADECRSFAAEAMERANKRRAGLFASLATWALGVLEIGLGRPEEAVKMMEPPFQRRPVLSHGVIVMLMTPEYMEAAVRCERVDQARAALTPFEQWAHAVGEPWALGSLAYCQGLVSAPDIAEERFAQALALYPRDSRPFRRARIELALGEVQRRNRKRREAREHLRSALVAFERLGAVPWEERASAELRATGEVARRRDVSTIAELTPQEMQIARLVGEGKSNKDVAAQLFLSPRTVEYHLGKVYGKLGISSRAELIRSGGPGQRQDMATIVPG